MDKENLHIKEQLWTKYENNTLSEEEHINFLEQMLESEDDIEALASLELADMPKYLEDEILEHIFTEDREKVSEKVGKPEGKINNYVQLFFYGAKVTFAAACAIVVLFNLPDISKVKTRPEPIEHKKTSYVAETVAFITDKIFDGGIGNDK